MITLILIINSQKNINERNEKNWKNNDKINKRNYPVGIAYRFDYHGFLANWLAGIDVFLPVAAWGRCGWKSKEFGVVVESMNELTVLAQHSSILLLTCRHGSDHPSSPLGVAISLHEFHPMPHSRHLLQGLR